MLSDINISHGSVATPLRCVGICNEGFIANFLLSVTVKEFWKSVIIWQSYGQEFGVLFFIGPRCMSISRIFEWYYVYTRVYRKHIHIPRFISLDAKEDSLFCSVCHTLNSTATFRSCWSVPVCATAWLLVRPAHHSATLYRDSRPTWRQLIH